MEVYDAMRRMTPGTLASIAGNTHSKSVRERRPPSKLKLLRVMYEKKALQIARESSKEIICYLQCLFFHFLIVMGILGCHRRFGAFTYRSYLLGVDPHTEVRTYLCLAWRNFGRDCVSRRFR